jgi:DNA-binding NtrC family response regulator
VYGIVQQHNGYVSCSTQPARGTSFEVYLPVMDEPALEVVGSEHEATILKGTETILLVDDEEPVRDLGCRILASAGYVVLTAVDARDALAIYHERHEEIALVILDLVMPGMGGKDCLDGLFVINPSAKVLIATGLPPEDQAKQSLESVAAGFVTKPFQINHLLKSVRAALDSAQETSHTITQSEQ